MCLFELISLLKTSKSQLAYTKHEHFSEITLFYGHFGNHMLGFFTITVYIKLFGN